MGKYERIIDSIDHERGNCLMLYKDNVGLLRPLGEETELKAIRALLEWFMGKDKEEALSGLGKSQDGRIAASIVSMLIEKQMRTAKKYVDSCIKKQRRSERNQSHTRVPDLSRD